MPEVRQLEISFDTPVLEVRKPKADMEKEKIRLLRWGSTVEVRLRNGRIFHGYTQSDTRVKEVKNPKDGFRWIILNKCRVYNNKAVPPGEDIENGRLVRVILFAER